MVFRPNDGIERDWQEWLELSRSFRKMNIYSYLCGISCDLLAIFR